MWWTQNLPETLTYSVVERGKEMKYKYIRVDLIADYMVVRNEVEVSDEWE